VIYFGPTGVALHEATNQRKQAMPYSATFEASTHMPRKAVYSRLSDFGGLKRYFPEAIEACDLEGSGIGSIRTIRMKGRDGVIVERLEVLVDGSLISYSIINDAPLPLERYHSVIALSDGGSGCRIRWSSNWIAKGGPRTRGPGSHRGFLQGHLCGRGTRCMRS
jgi:Polyketide cyclase / dehydrase and lipid transport